MIILPESIQMAQRDAEQKAWFRLGGSLGTNIQIRQFRPFFGTFLTNAIKEQDAYLATASEEEIKSYGKSYRDDVIVYAFMRGLARRSEAIPAAVDWFATCVSYDRKLIRDFTSIDAERLRLPLRRLLVSVAAQQFLRVRVEND